MKVFLLYVSVALRAFVFTFADMRRRLWPVGTAVICNDTISGSAHDERNLPSISRLLYNKYKCYHRGYLQLN